MIDEAFDCWDQGKNTYDYGRFFNQWSTIDIGDMVMRDRNHPSVIIWSIGNEIPDDNNATVAQSLITAVKAKDTTRVIGQAFNRAQPPATQRLRWKMSSASTTGPIPIPGRTQQSAWKLFASESSSAVRSQCMLPKHQSHPTS